jgi:hypothetical protein
MPSLLEELEAQINARAQAAQVALTTPPSLDPPASSGDEAIADTLNQIYDERLETSRQVVENYGTTLNTALIAARAYRDTLYDYTDKVKTMAETQTFLRKSYFLNLEHDSMVAYSAYGTFLIWACAVVYVKVAIYDYKAIRNIKAWIGLIAIIVSPFLLVILLQVILQIPKRVNIYSTWLSDGRQEWHGGA